MSSKKIKSDELFAVIQMELASYSDEVLALVDEEASSAADGAVKELRQTSPVGRRKRYRRGWRKLKDERTPVSVRYVVHNKTDPGLTHLLEFGHVIKNQFGEYKRKSGGGKTGAKPHIKPAEENAAKAFADAVTRKLEG